MVELVFNHAKVPRTTTREEWKAVYHWLRSTRRELRKQLDEQTNLLRVYGSTMPKEMKQNLMNKIINPPILLGPWQ